MPGQDILGQGGGRRAGMGVVMLSRGSAATVVPKLFNAMLVAK